MRGRLLGGVAVVSAIAVGTAAISCRQVIGLDPYFNAPVDAGPNTSACGLPYGTSACAACAQANCCNESTACAGDPACAPHFQCLGGCATGDWTCRAQCRLDHRVGLTAGFAPLSTCVASKCENECGLTCGGIDNGAPPDAGAACQQCLNAKACAGERACASSIDCEKSLQCFEGCSTPDCRAVCFRGNDAGLSLFGPVSSGPGFGVIGPIMSPIMPPPVACSTECGSGANWSCVGHLAWPAPTGAGSSLSLTLLDFVTSQRASGVDVTVCQGVDPSCVSPLGHGQTDPNGNVTVSVPAGTYPFGGLGANGYLELTAASTVPELFYWGYPISQPQAPLSLPFAFVATPAELQQLASATGIPVDMARGLLSIYVVDCLDSAAPGVQVSIDATDPTVIGPRYGAAATLSGAATDSSAFARFINVPPGSVTVTATPLALSKPSSHASVLIRAGYFTTVMLHPTP